MFRIFRPLLAFIVAATATSAIRAQPALPTNVTVLTNATVIDCTGAPARSGMTIILTGQTITVDGGITC